MRIVLDAMGTDRHPQVEVQGAVRALREVSGDFEIVLVGDRTAIEAELAVCEDYPADRLHVVDAPEVIAPGEPPATALRRKPNSSIAVGLGMQREGQAQAFVSAGSTGAVMAASLFLLRPLPGVDRPAIGTPLPTAAQPLLLLDAGANVDCKPDQLLQFARLGSVYVEDVWRRPRPRVGILNIGEEPEKGDELTVEAHRLLAGSDLNFIGNVEGRDVVKGPCDVLVADGFVGNVLLKFYEAVTTFMRELLRQELTEQDVQLDLRRLFHVFDYTEYGGAPLLGVNGVSIICHGGSPPRAIANAIRVAVQAVDTRMVGHIRREVESHPGEVDLRRPAAAGNGAPQRQGEDA